MSQPATSAPELGRRERKKAATGERIASTALDLFLEHGFDQVTIAQIASAADVSQQTVFNHFPTKEDLVYARLEGFEDDLLAGVRDREPGESAIAAFRRELLARHGLLGKNDARSRHRLLQISRMIEASPALRHREDQVFATRTDALAALLRDEHENGIAPWVVANALIGVHRALVLATRRGILNGIPSAELAQNAVSECTSALDMLERGLAHQPAR